MPRNRALPTLIYHDIFDYPLTEEELLRWEVGRRPRGPLARRGSEISGAWRFALKKTGKHFHLKGRSSIVKLRLEREKESAKKLKLARKISTKLSTIPTIKFIGVTGSLAMNNAKRESDIDLMIITSANTLWSTRVAVKIASLFSGFIVRSAGNDEVGNAVCFNMWLDSQHLAIPQKMRNLYTAHEVLQVAPLINRDRMFEKFIESNSWALSYWPMAKSGQVVGYSGQPIPSILNTLYRILTIFEPLAYFLQKIYMSNKRTRELIQPGRAFFHPVDWASMVIREFNKRIGSP